MMTGAGLSAAPETERRASPFDFDTWVSNSPALLHLTGADGRLIAASDEWLAKLGYTRAEATGRPLAEFLAPGSLALAGALRDGCAGVAGQFLAKHGQRIDVLASCVLAGGLHGQSAAAIVDVTATKEAQRKLAAELSQYRSLVEDQAELVSLASADGRLLYVNKAFARHFQRGQEDLIGKSMSDFVPEGAHSALEQYLRRVRESQLGLTSKNQVVLPNGQLCWISWTNRALRDEFGEVTGIHSVGRDIEQMVEAERRLKDSEARYRLLTEHSTDMVLELDANLRRRYVSPACR
ncbi:MAG: PAS domain S-box protein, partial [Hyphomicrobiales bacterium]|nr:PAS domain S-box protein [Hyphomicrobiales bacterium]